MSAEATSGGSLTRSVKRGVVWSTLTFGLSKGAIFLSILVLTRVLTPSQFGVVGGVLVMLSLIEITSDLGMKATVIYEQEHGHDRVQTAFTLNMIVATTLTIVGVACSPLIARFFHAPSHVNLFRLASLDVFVTGLGSIHDGLLLRDLRFNRRIATEVVSAVVRGGTGAALALLGFGAASMVWGLLLGTIVWTILQWALTPFRPKLKLDRKVAPSMINYGIGASMLTVVDQVWAQVDSSTVGRVLGPRALGLYTVSFRLPTLLLENIAYQVSLVAFPALSRKRTADAEGVGPATHRLVRYQALYALPLAAGMAVLARPIVVVVFSSRWRDAAGVLAAISVMSGISASGFALGDGFKALGRQRVMVVMDILEFPLVVGTIIAAAQFGITAVAWARSGAEILWVLLMVIAAARVLGVAVRGTLVALWPGMVAAGGVILAAGAVRIFSGFPSVALLAVATPAGVFGALLALASLAPSTFQELRMTATRLLRSRGRRHQAAVTDVESAAEAGPSTG